MKKLRAEWIQGIPATIQSRNLCLLPICYTKTHSKIYKSIILPSWFIWVWTWFFTLSEEHNLRVLWNRVLRKIFGRMRNTLTGNRRRLHNMVIYNLYTLWSNQEE